jgi:hypothetical protein
MDMRKNIGNSPTPICPYCVKLLAALEEIAEGRGRYNPDRVQHLVNCCEDMTELAKNAIAEYHNPVKSD